MNPPQNPPPPWLIPFICVVFPIFFVGLWSFVCLLLSAVGGWSRLAQKFPGSAVPSGPRFSGQSGRMGWVNYNGVLTIHISPEGLHLAVMKLFRIGHPPILIPWAEVRNAVSRRFFVRDTVVFEAGGPALAKVQLPKKVFAGAPIEVDGRRAPSEPPPLS